MVSENQILVHYHTVNLTEGDNLYLRQQYQDKIPEKLVLQLIISNQYAGRNMQF